MATAYTSLLGLALPVTGELSGTWGDTVNTSITNLLDTAVAGTTSITTDADITLTTTTGVANQARQAIILWNPASGTVTRNITAPAQSKIYTVINASGGTQSIVFRGAGPTTGVTIAKGESAVVAWNGTDFIKVSNTSGAGVFTNLSASGTVTFTGLSASQAVFTDASDNLVSNAITGTGNVVMSASPTLTGTITAAGITASGNIVGNGNWTIGNADTDTITQAASYVTGTQLKSAKTATNTLALAAYDVDGAAYTNLVTLTASNTPTLALTSTGVGTINNMSVGATTASTGAFTTLSANSTVTFTGLSASQAVFTDASDNLVSNAITGTGNVVMSNSPTLVTPALGTPSSINLTNATGLPASSGISGLGTGVATALAVNVGTAGAFVVNGGDLGTPSSGTVTNLTGTASININGTVGATTATTGAFTTLTASGTVTGNGNWVIGNADTDTITQGAAYVTGTQLRSAKTATNTLALAAYDVDGAAYTNLVTLTASNTPTLALTSTGVGTINNMSIGATTASTGAFTTVSASGVASFAAGTALLPAITRTGDTNTGIYFPAADTIGFTEGGVEALRLNSNGQTSTGIAGTAALPSFTRTGDENTGIFFPAADTIAFSEGGAEAMRIDSSGNLGIGTSSPTQKLDVAGTVRIVETGTPSGDAALQISVNGTNARTIRMTDTDTSGKTFDFINRAQSIAGNFGFFDNTAGAYRYIIDSSGNLGLGVTPSAWASSQKAIQLGSAGAINGSTNTSLIGVNANAFFNGTNNIYINSAAASQYLQVSGEHRWSTAASGTAGNAITFTQAMTLDASGNLALGTTSSNGMRLNIKGYSPELYDPTTSSAKFLYLPKGSQEIFEVSLGATPKAGYANLINISVNDDLGGDGVYYGAVGQSVGNSAAHFVFGRRTGGTSWAESARIDSSGNLLVGISSYATTPAAGVTVQTGDNASVNIGHTNSSTGFLFVNFGYNSGQIGSITQSGTTAVAYNTTSDYRLKENVQPLAGALSRIAALKPCTYTWKSAPDEIGEGFIAHELQEVCPQAVTGEKDAVNEDGSIKPQSIDTSFLVATLTAALQEAHGLIKDQAAAIQTLTARVTALESN
jgi:hypothetical protein